MATATLAETQRRNANDLAPVRLLPVDTTGWASMAASLRFGPFEPGDYVTIAVDAAAHINAGNDTSDADATNPQIPFGLQDFVMPTGTTHVSIFGNGSGNGVAWKS